MGLDTRTITMAIDLDTRDFDRKLRRIRRQATRARIWTHLWLALYAAAMTGVALTLAIVEVTR